jgi:hypothetical protein
VSGEKRIEGQYCACGYCHAVTWEGSPHPEGEPCPLKLRVDEAYIAMLDAQRMSYLRQGVMAEDLTKKFLGDDEEE